MSDLIRVDRRALWQLLTAFAGAQHQVLEIYYTQASENNCVKKLTETYNADVRIRAENAQGGGDHE